MLGLILDTVVALYAMAVDFVFKQGTGSAAPARLSGDASVAHTLSCNADDVNISDSRPSSEDGAESELEAPPLDLPWLRALTRVRPWSMAVSTFVDPE